GRRDDARRERRRIQPVLGGADPVRVDRLRMALVDLAAPGEQEALSRGPALEHGRLRHRRQVGAARRLRDDRERGGREAAQVLPRLVVVDVDQLPELPRAAERGERRLQVGHVAAGPVLELAVRGREARLELLVDEGPPHLLERHGGAAPLDPDAAVAERTAFLVRLGDLGLERDDAGESWAEVFGHAWISSSLSSRPAPRSRAAASTSAAAARSWTATPTDLYSVISTGVARPRFAPETSSPSSQTVSGSTFASSGAPPGGGENADSLDSTTIVAARTRSGSSSEPGALQPTELTCVPGATQAARTTGSAECVVAATTSAPRTASSSEAAALTPSSAARAAVRSGSRPATRTSVQSRMRAKARAWERAWTPVPTIASTWASSRASSRVASAAAAAVRVAVMNVPSISAIGVPFAGSKSAIAAWCDGRSVLPGKTVTSLHPSPADGRYAGIAPSRPVSASAPIRGGIDAAPAESSSCARARAPSSSSGSRSSSTSARVRTSIRQRRYRRCAATCAGGGTCRGGGGFESTSTAAASSTATATALSPRRLRVRRLEKRSTRGRATNWCTAPQPSASATSESFTSRTWP